MPVTEEPLELFIGDVNRITQEIIAPPTDQNPGPVTNAVVTFTIRKIESPTGAFVGTANHSMPHYAEGQYVGTWAQAESLDLVLRRRYWLHIQANGYTLRMIPCIAVYRQGQ